MKFLRPLFLSLLLITAFNSFSLAQEWSTNFEQAKTEASSDNKLILLSFSGSDWCANCIRLDKTLFHSDEFKTYCADNFVLLKADFPMKKKNKLSDDQTTHNEMLAEKYNKNGVFPTVVILNSEGKVMGTMDNPKESAVEYITQLKKIKK